MAMTPLTGTPTRTMSQSAFDSACNDFFSTKLPLFVTEANALQVDVDAKKTLAETAATTATTQAGIATTQAGNATTQAGLALGYKNDAAASAASAVNSPGTQATSASSISVGAGSKSLTLAQTGKNFVVGQFVAIARTSDPSGTWLNGAITAFNAGTGDMTVNVVNAYGATGPYTDWTISQSAPVAPNTVAIGALRFSQDVGTVISPIGSDPATYLRTGTVATAATYPAGALVDYIKAYGQGNVSLGAFVGDIATDGNQTIVCTYDNANVMVSTNGGATWSSVAANISGAGIARSVCWTGTRFVVAGGTAACSFAYSTNGTSWTTGATEGGSNTGQMRIRWDGSNCIAVTTSGTSPNATIYAIRSADGSAATSAATISSSSIYAVRDLIVMPSLGANQWLVITDRGSTFRSTASDGSGWSAAQSGPFTNVYSACVAGNKFVLAGNSNFYYSTTGLAGSWTQFTAPTIGNFVGVINVLSKNALHWDGTRLWVGSNLGTSASVYSNSCVYTTDTTSFTSWSELQLTYPLAGQVTYGAGIGPVVCGNHLLFIPLDGFSSGSGQGHTGTVNASYQLNWASGPS